MNKLINEALKDIWSLEEPENQKIITKYWLRRMFREGKIAGLQWSLQNNAKHSQK
jgi:hypothetical protein